MLNRGVVDILELNLPGWMDHERPDIKSGGHLVIHMIGGLEKPHHKIQNMYMMSVMNIAISTGQWVGYWPWGYTHYHPEWNPLTGNKDWFYNDPPITLVATADTFATAYSNSRIIIVDSNERAHITYTSNDTVYYMYSDDDLVTVSEPVSVGIGRYPGLAIDGNEYPHICWISEYSGGYMLYHSKLTASGWTTPDELLKAPKAKFTPASFDIDKEENKAHLSWADFPTAGDKWYIYKGDFSLLDTTPKIIPVPYDSAVQMTPESPNYICDQEKVEGYLLWEKKGEVYAGVEYDGGSVQEITNISDSPNPSIHPNLSLWGDNLYAVWQEEYPFGNKIFFTKRSTDILSSWQEPVEIKAFPELVEYPVCHGPYVFASGKAHAKANYDIYGYREDEFGDASYLLKMTTTKTKSMFPALCFAQHFPKQKLFVIGTEDTTSMRGEIGWVFGKCVVEGAPPPIPITAANLGSPDGSPYTIQREGYKVFGYRAYQSVDYHTEELKYRFTGLKPSERYKLKLVFNYREEDREEGQDIIPSNKNWMFKVKVGGHPIGVVKIKPNGPEPIYFEKWVSRFRGIPQLGSG